MFTWQISQALVTLTSHLDETELNRNNFESEFDPNPQQTTIIINAVKREMGSGR